MAAGFMAAGCASGPPPPFPGTYVVRPRDTLYSIAWRHDLDYRDIARWNHLGKDYRIDVGEVLRLEPGRGPRPPVTAARRPVTGTATATGTATGVQGTVAGATAGALQTVPGRPGQPCGSAEQHWTWPTARVTAPRPVPGGGILLLGTVGQPIRAACAGRVVYAGNGIRGYGNLIIIKHGEAVLSAYAHTVDLAVHEGQEVTLGEEIAHMGTGAHEVAALYFEIRLNGKPVDPLPFLPSE
jgi:lipoprotein NlpD